MTNIFPGGKCNPEAQCVITCAYAHMNNAESAFLGKFGNDEVAECIQAALKNMNVDFSHSRNYEGENGFACVTLNQGDRCICRVQSWRCGKRVSL